MLIGFLTVSGVLFWVLFGIIAAATVGMLSSEDDDLHGMALAVTGGAIALAVLFSDVSTYFVWQWFVAGLILYAVFGVVWAFKKWVSYGMTARDGAKMIYAKDPGTETWEAYSARVMPKAVDHKRRITGWMLLWPFSFTWWVTNWPRHAAIWLYNRLATTFDRIMAKVWAQ